MAILRHDVAKKQHRERAQPNERKKWGLLEKKKDYKLRAQDYHKKEAYLKHLKNKVSERNPDEYHHGMVNKKTDNRGIVISERGNEELSNSAAKLLKTQDSGYVKTLHDTESRKIEKLEADLMFKSQGNHKVFVDSTDDAQKFSAAKYFHTDPSLVNRRENRLRKSQLESKELEAGTELTENLNKKRMQKYKELNRRSQRKEELGKVQQEMNLQRELMKKGDKKKTVDKDGKVSWKWKNVRKK